MNRKDLLAKLSRIDELDTMIDERKEMMQENGAEYLALHKERDQLVKSLIAAGVFVNDTTASSSVTGTADMDYALDE